MQVSAPDPIRIVERHDARAGRQDEVNRVVHRLRRLRETFGGFEPAETVRLTAAENVAIVLLHFYCTEF